MESERFQRKEDTGHTNAPKTKETGKYRGSKQNVESSMVMSAGQENLNWIDELLEGLCRQAAVSHSSRETQSQEGIYLGDLDQMPSINMEEEPLGLLAGKDKEQLEWRAAGSS